MQIIIKNIGWQALMEIWYIAKFDHCATDLSWDVALTEWCAEQKRNGIRKAGTKDLNLNANLKKRNKHKQQIYFLADLIIIEGAIMLTVIRTVCFYI